MVLEACDDCMTETEKIQKIKKNVNLVVVAVTVEKQDVREALAEETVHNNNQQQQQQCWC